MPMKLEGSCRCGAVSFSVMSHTPVPYQRCYCSICRKQQGGGGYAINLGALNDTMTISGRENLRVFRAEIADDEGHCKISSGERNFCGKCGSAMWLYDQNWPELIHPFASAIDTDLPIPEERVHLMLKFRANWVEPDLRSGDKRFDEYPTESLADWHKRNGQWVD